MNHIRVDFACLTAPVGSATRLWSSLTSRMHSQFMADLLESLRLAALPAPAEAFRAEVKAFIAQALPPAPPDVRSRSWLAFDAAFSRRLAERGWVGVTLPKRYGGAELDAFSRFVLVEELLAVGAPVGAHWIADRQSGPLILKFGNDSQKDRHLPRICRGESYFCIGMSEPNAGSDLASVGTRAERTASGWRLNGRKVWTTNGHRCDHAIVLVRTSGTAADRHGGLSQFIVDLRLPGITIRPIVDLTGDAHFSEMFFDDVQLAEDDLVGREGDGWHQVTAELAFERSGPERLYSSIVLLDAWLQWLRDSGTAEQHLEQVGRFTAHLATLRQMSIAVTSQLATGGSPVVEAALVKDIGSEFEQAVPAVIESALAADPALPCPPELLRTAAYVSQMAPTFSLRGGTREILRGMIARGLGLR
jgi:alkylation response protein AidB-like acyl-CoA dehydrogenase